MKHMKLTKIYSGIMALLMGAAMLTACSDDDSYTSYSTPLLTDGAVVTGSSDVTATTATFYGTVAGLEQMNAASYATGFYWGTDANALTETVTAASDASFTGTVSGLAVNQTIYYQAYVTLQGRLTYKGEVKSLVTTNAKATTGDVTDIDFATATMAGTVSQYPADATAGIVISTSSDQEAVRAGLRLAVNPLADSYSITQAGLLPNTHYYYAAYLDLGSGVVYGDVKDFVTAANDIDVDDEFVDLGLSVKWAKRNIGAKTPSDMGGLFAFGDLTGCNPSIEPADYASADTYKSALDLANVALGGKGTLPTADLFEELFSLCKTEWLEADGVSGYQITGPNGNSIFLPAAGKRVAHEVSDQRTQGYYLTGSVNGGNSQYAVDYEFTSATRARSTRAVYEALSVRPVSTARNIKFQKELLYNTWHIDLRADGSHAHFDNPCWFMGTDDSWRTITNGEPIVGNSWLWAPGAGDSWVYGGTARDFGTMTFTEDGKVVVTKMDAEGNATTEEGTYTVDEANKTITLTIDVLDVPAQSARGDNKRTKLNILSLTEETLQIGMLIDGNSGQVSFNYASDMVYSGVSVSLLAVGSDWGGTWGSSLAMLSPQELEGQHTVRYEGAVNGAMVTLLDFVGLKQKFPNAFARIDEIKLDGQAIKFNANNFCYGDIENNGNYRIEMFNIWGKGAQNGKIVASPFSNLKDVDSDPAFTFAQSCEITFTVRLSGPEATFTPNLITINPSWGGTWGFNQGATFQVTLNAETAKYEVSQQDFNILYTSGDHAAGSIMTFVQIDNIRSWFPTMHCTLNSLKLDGQGVSYDKAGVLDSNENDAYRLELWNMYGMTSQSGCAFGTPQDGVIKELGFSNSMELNFTINSLFAVPEF
jgi:hypothetical protein